MRPRGGVSVDLSLGRLPGWISVQRAGPALFWSETGALVRAETNQPCFAHDPVTLAPRGLMLRPAQTNLLAHSDARFGVGWSDVAVTCQNLSLNALGMFDGVHVASSGVRWARLTHDALPDVTAGQSYTFTLLYRAGTSGRIRCIFRTSTGLESRLAGAIGGPLADLGAAAGVMQVASDVVLSDGMTRMLHVSFTAAASGQLSIGIGPDSPTDGETITLLAAQFEQAPYSGLILTQGAPAARAPDQAEFVSLKGTYTIRATYGDGTTEQFDAQQVGPGYWPALSQSELLSLVLRPA